MGKLFNSIISNDIAFYSLIFFLVAFLIIMIVAMKKKQKKYAIKEDPILSDLNEEIDEKEETIVKAEKEEKVVEKAKKLDIDKTEKMIETFASSEKSKQILKDIMQETETLDDEPISAIDKIMQEEVDEEELFKEETTKIEEPIQMIEEKIEEKTEEKPVEKIIDKIEEQEEKHEQIEFNIDQIISETEQQFAEKTEEDVFKLASKMNEIENTNEEAKETRLEKFNQISKSLEEKEVKVEEKDTKSELEKVLEKMQKDLDEQKETDAVALFEQEQEERAIISYKELLEKKDELIQMTTDERFENEKEYENDSDFDYEKYINEYNKEEYVPVIEKITEETKQTIDIPEIKEDNTEKPKKFVTTDFISPVFGRREAELDYPKVHNISDVIKTEKTNEYDLEATMNLDPIREKLQEDDAFLSALKEFRKKLE